MRFDDYIAQRLETDEELRAELERTRPALEVRMAIVQARVAAGLTQAELASRMGIKQSAVARLERGDSVPRVDSLQRLADALGTEFHIVPGKPIQAIPREVEQEALRDDTSILSRLSAIEARLDVAEERARYQATIPA